MNQKIAILTQPLARNYGGIIQNYALQKVLRDLGHTPITVNRVKGMYDRGIKHFLKSTKLGAFGYNLIFQHISMTVKEEQRIIKHNLRFIDDNIQRSRLIDSTWKLSRYFREENFSTVIVGSDQTWRPKYSPNIYNFYLDFLEDNPSTNKIAYASSFGTAKWEYTEEQENRCKQLAKAFDAISVREDSGISLCENHLGIKAQHVLDPALLLDPEDYNQIIQRPKEEKGLFTYVLDQNEDNKLLINTCAEKLGLRVTHNQAKHQFNFREKRDLEDYIIPPIEGWLQGFRDAEFVITDSFHGTAFSILNNKPFLAIVNKKRGASRFLSFLSAFGLTDRLVEGVTKINYELLTQKIDYKPVNERLEKMKKESLQFLIDNLWKLSVSNPND